MKGNVMDQTYEYVFSERWMLPGTPGQVYDALLDFELYPRWGYPGYVAGRRHGEPGVGCRGTLVVQGVLPFKVTLDCTITRLVPGREIGISVTGDLVGQMVWRIRPLPDGGAELSKDWRCNPRALIPRLLGSALRPLVRWNHEKCLSAAMAGLAEYLAPAARPGQRQMTG